MVSVWVNEKTWPTCSDPLTVSGRGVDGVHLLPGRGPVEAVDAVGLPARAPLVFEALEGRFIGNGVGHDPATVLACCACTTPHWARSPRSSCASPDGCRCTSADRRSPANRTSGHGRFNVAWDVLRRYLTWTRPRRPLRVQRDRHRGQDHHPGHRREAASAEEVAAALRAGVVGHHGPPGRRAARPRRRTPPPTWSA